MCDFETTVYKGQEYTEVWASASVELYTEDVQIFHSIDEQFNYFLEQDCNIIAYYHNLKFDGSFWLSYLLIDKHFKQAYDKTGEAENAVVWKKINLWIIIHSNIPYQTKVCGTPLSLKLTITL